MEDYYNIMEEQQAIGADSKKNDAPNADEMKSFHKVDKAMAKLRKEYYQVKSDTAMDAEVKRSELDRLDEEMRALAREGITILDRITNKGSSGLYFYCRGVDNNGTL